MLSIVRSWLRYPTDCSERQSLLGSAVDSPLFGAQVTSFEKTKELQELPATTPLSDQTSSIIEDLETAYKALLSLSLPIIHSKTQHNNLGMISVAPENSIERTTRLKLSPLLEEEHNLISDTCYKCFMEIYTRLSGNLLADTNTAISIKNNVTISPKLLSFLDVIISTSKRKTFQSKLTDIKLHSNGYYISLEFCFSSESVKIIMHKKFTILNLTITYNYLFSGYNEHTLITTILNYSSVSNIWKISARAISYEWFTQRYGIMNCTNNDGGCVTYTGELWQKSIEDLPSGCGKIKVELPGKPTIEFYGNFTKGKMDGNGIMHATNSSDHITMYAGEWNNGKMTGRGNIYFKESDGSLQVTTVVMRNNMPVDPDFRN